MILHAGVLSLIVGTIIVIMMLAYASWLGLTILKNWDLDSGSAAQLALERKTYLVSTLMNYVLGFVTLSTFLFIYTADDIHNIFIGAMCATGSLNANPVGWNVLYTKIIVFFLSLIWVTINRIDQRAEDYPLVRVKYALLLLLTPVILLDAYYLLTYFSGLKPNIITSCCGALFSEDRGAATGLTSLPVRPMMIAFYSTIAAFLLNGVIALRLPNKISRNLSIFLAPAVFLVSITSVVSFGSLYFYELPTHHCPFDILRREYYFVGYPLYLTLFGGVFFGLITGIMEPFRKIASLREIIGQAQKKWTMQSIILIFLFTMICSWPIIFSDFTMEGYW